MLKDFATTIVRTLRQRGFQAYLVGGCVRDILLKREPKDYDVSTDATPEQVMEIFPDTYAVGAQFGVVLVPAPNAAAIPEGASKSCVVEVATFRSDIGYSDGRHPDEVRFSKTPREDVARRDFTINGMLLDPLNGEILDYVGGQEDLKAGIVRTIGDPEQRFAEDKLRMLRAVRFASRLEYAIDRNTFYFGFERGSNGRCAAVVPAGDSARSAGGGIAAGDELGRGEADFSFVYQGRIGEREHERVNSRGYSDAVGGAWV